MAHLWGINLEVEKQEARILNTESNRDPKPSPQYYKVITSTCGYNVEDKMRRNPFTQSPYPKRLSNWKLRRDNESPSWDHATDFTVAQYASLVRY